MPSDPVPGTRRRQVRLLLAIGMLPLAALALLFIPPRAQPVGPVAVNAIEAFSGPVNGGCYAIAATQCSIHVASWQPIPIAPGKQLQAVRLEANGRPLYDFRTDVSNPPNAPYSLSLVAQDFGATCGVTYTLTLLAQEKGDPGYTTIGSTNAFACPLLATPTPTATPTSPSAPVSTATPTATATQIVNRTATVTATPTGTRTPDTVYLPAVQR